MNIVSGLLNQTITTIYSTTIDGYGAVTKTTVYSDIICRWQENFQTILDNKGQETVVKIEAWLPNTHNNSTVYVDVDYVFLYNGVEYKVISYTNHVNLLGEREYIKVFLK